MHEPAGPATKRTRTPRQLQRKRALDKATQRRRRGQHQDYVRRIEGELRDARDQIGYLRGVIRAIQAEQQLGPDDADSTQPSRAPHSRVRGPDSAETASSVVPRAYQPRNQRSIECCCRPKLHGSYSECFEMTVFNDLIKLCHLQPPIPAIPPTPELADILFLRPPQDPVSNILYKLTRRVNLNTVVCQAAAYILCHRVLRYRLFPSVETHNDVPEWLRSTDAQDTIPHALYIDFVQFPRLRNAMVLGLVDIECFREQFDTDFGRHVSVNWPDSKPFLVSDDSGATALNPEFAQHVCVEENWSLDAQFAVKYPDIAPLVTVRG